MRLLYGGRNSLVIGSVATLITMVLGDRSSASSPATSAASIDGILSRFLDLIWAYPAVPARHRARRHARGRRHQLGPFKISGNSLFVPAFIIGIVYIPYVAKPIRAQVLKLREREFVDAARQQGLGTSGSCSARSCRTSPRRSSSSSR